MTPSAFSALLGSFDGPLVLPGDDSFDASRKPWNLAVEQNPAGVAYPAGTDDLRRILKASRDSDLPLAVQTAGDGAADDMAGALLVRMSAFDDLDIDLDAGVVRVGAGVHRGRVVEALEGTGWQCATSGPSHRPHSTSS